jgi:apolipoprotein N-acyltransferase
MQKKLRILLPVISGILLSIPWLAPGYCSTLFFAFVPLLIAEEKTGKQKIASENYAFFWPSFLTFLTWNLLSTWWIAHVSLSGMLLVTFLNSLLMASVWWSRHLVGRKFGHASSSFSLIVFWIAFEYLHHNWTLPWPWLSLGNGFANSVELIQWYEYTGILGGTFWILITNLLLYSAVRSYREASPFSKTVKQSVFAILSVILPVLGSLVLYKSYAEKGDSLEVLVLQPNIDPYTEKFSIDADFQINKIVNLTKPNLTDSTGLVVAPETCWPLLWEDSLLTQKHSLLPLTKIIQHFPKVSVMVGAITQGSIVGDSLFDVYNSTLLVDSTLNIQISHKCILVNGVERMPFQSYFSFLNRYLLDLGGTRQSMTAGEKPSTFSVGEILKIGPVICFESVFGAYCSQLVRNGSDLLVVITNDGWWRESAGSWQHFGYSRLRAVESRRTIVQSANTGISGIIDQRGNVIQRTGLNTYAAVKSPVRLNHELTFYVMNGDWIGRFSLLLSGLIAFYILMHVNSEKAKKIRINSIVKIPNK